jgi:leader peptidase (prepilin peptidase)/N-methyltransferase
VDGFGIGGLVRVIAGQNRVFLGAGKGRHHRAGLLALPGAKSFCNDRTMGQIMSQNAVILLVAAPFVGSFLGLLIERLPVRESVVLGRSRCRMCGAALGLLDLVPLLSWAASGGRCRHCHAALGWFHPGIELAAFGVALWSVLVVPGWLAWASTGLGWTLLALAMIDQRHMIVPDALSLPLVPAGLAVAALTPAGGFVHHMAGIAAGAASLGAVAWTYERATGREGLGLGDVKLFAAAGAWVGWQGLPSVLLIGAAAGLAAACILARAKGAPGPREPVAFGPYLALGLWITWLYGPVNLQWT